MDSPDPERKKSTEKSWSKTYLVDSQISVDFVYWTITKVQLLPDMFERESFTVKQHCQSGDLCLSFLLNKSLVLSSLHSYQTLVRTSNRTNVEANHSSTGKRSGSHFPEKMFFFSCVETKEKCYQASGWRPSVRTGPWSGWRCWPLQTRHDPACADQISHRSRLLISILGRDGVANVLLVVNPQTVELGQDVHCLGHIPFSSSGIAVGRLKLLFCNGDLR